MLGLVTSINAKNVINQPSEGIYQIDSDMLSKKISDIEGSLNDGSWMNKDYSYLDEVMMPDLVRMANEKKIGLNLIYLNSPPALFKPTQGRNRMNQYVSANPRIENLAVNKKGQNIIERQHDNSEEINGKPLSKSIHNKRLTEYKSFINWVNLNKQQ